MTTPPDFGGHEIEEGLLEDLGGPAEDRAVSHHDGARLDDNEAHAPGKVCVRDLWPGHHARPGCAAPGRR